MDGNMDFGWLWGVAGAGGTYLVRLVFDRRKLKAETNSSELDADTKAVDLYERFAARLSPQVEALQSKWENLMESFMTLKTEHADIRIENNQLKSENILLKAENEVVKQQNIELKEEVHSIRQDLDNLKNQVNV